MNRLRTLPTWWRVAFALAVFAAVSGAMATAADVSDGRLDGPAALRVVPQLGILLAISLAIAAWRMEPHDAPPAGRPGVFLPGRLWMLQLVAWLLPAVLLPIPFFFGALWGTPRLVTAAMVAAAFGLVGIQALMAYGLRYEVTGDYLIVRLPRPRQYALSDITEVVEIDARRIALKLADESDVVLGRPEDYETFRDLVLQRAPPHLAASKGDHDD